MPFSFDFYKFDVDPVLKTELIKPYGRVSFEGDVCSVSFYEDCVVTEEIIQDIHETGRLLSNQKPHCMLVDLSLNVSSTSEARKYGANNEYIKYHLAYALIGQSLPVNLLVNFFIKINKPKIQTKLFSNREEALTWLKHVLKQINS